MERSFGCKLTIGPPIKGGYYYDAYVGDEVCTEKDWYPVLQKKYDEIVKEKQACLPARVHFAPLLALPIPWMGVLRVGKQRSRD